MPGLEDDESNTDDENDETDNGTDGDVDGGYPPDTSSLPGGTGLVIEDDLLESYVLAIDDFDIA